MECSPFLDINFWRNCIHYFDNRPLISLHFTSVINTFRQVYELWEVHKSFYSLLYIFLFYSWMMFSVLFRFSICVIAEISSKHERYRNTKHHFFHFSLTFLEQMKPTEIPCSKLVLPNLNSRLCSTA